jgi:hypothetical protein
VSVVGFWTGFDAVVLPPRERLPYAVVPEPVLTATGALTDEVFRVTVSDGWVVVKAVVPEATLQDDEVCVEPSRRATQGPFAAICVVSAS